MNLKKVRVSSILHFYITFTCKPQYNQPTDADMMFDPQSLNFRQADGGVGKYSKGLALVNFCTL